MKNPIIITSVLILILLFPALSVKGSTDNNFPLIDGFWTENEWPDSIISEYVFTDQVKVKFSYRLNETHLFFTARYQDNTPTHTVYEQDAFAIGFDNNGDQSNMGTSESPDDSIFIGFDGNYSIDVYMQGIGKKIIKDVDAGGINNSIGRYSISSDNFYTYEFIKPLNSGDTKGNDIKLEKGNNIFIMLAYWDNLSPFAEISGFSEWINLIITDPINDSFVILDYIIPLTLAVLVVIAFIYIRVKSSS